jgi:hypothetical protein
VLRLGEWWLKTARTKTHITPFVRLLTGAAGRMTLCNFASGIAFGEL